MAAAVCALLAIPAGAQQAAPPPAAIGTTALAEQALRIVYLSREGDVAYQPVPSESGVFRPALPEPSPGADLAIRDTRPTAHALGLVFTLEKHVLAEGASVEDEAKALAGSGAVAVIADLPAEDLMALAKAVPAASLAIFNIRHADDALRRDFCKTGLFHVLPSTSMLTDALAQFVVSKNWRKVLVLHGPLPADQSLSDTFAASAKKFGARIVDTKAFLYGNDPRKREQIDIGLMTASDDFDVVFLADTGGDFGRYVPYQLVKPRPVIGTEGLQATAWDALAERFGAPQVNHRFERLAHRDMNQGDWAAWVAVRAVIEAAIRSKARDAATVEAALAHDDLPIDVSKGVQSSFRPWDHQFRQAVMLHSGDAVIAYAPIEGFLHQRTPLDTLGVDEAESPCRPQ
jgi:ABC transporter substrate binding protein (PQQ-dependent alcohol dehydrogenase system)